MSLPKAVAMGKQVAALEQRRPVAGRVFRIIVNEDEADAVIEALNREHGITAEDLVLVREIIGPRPQQ
jgi:hypothetical protein